MCTLPNLEAIRAVSCKVVDTTKYFCKSVEKYLDLLSVFKNSTGQGQLEVRLDRDMTSIHPLTSSEQTDYTTHHLNLLLK